LGFFGDGLLDNGAFERSGKARMAPAGRRKLTRSSSTSAQLIPAAPQKFSIRHHIGHGLEANRFWRTL
jgi:hypothetical protein